MIKQQPVKSKILSLVLLLQLVLLPGAGAVDTPKANERQPGKFDNIITRQVVDFMTRFHFDKEHRKLDEEKSRFFLRTYIESLDNLNLFFLQSDIDNFMMFTRGLDAKTRAGDISIAHQIFDKFMDRLEENYKFAHQTLDTATFEFNDEARYLVNRRDADPPANKAEQRALWTTRLRYEYLQEKLNKTEHDEIIKTLKRRYDRIRRHFKELDGDDILQLYLSSLTRAYDPHSDYMGRHDLDNFEISMKLSLQGIGALLSSPDGTCEIVRVIPGGPAARSKKIHSKDKIVAVAQADEDPVDVVDMPLRKVVDLIRGEKGTEVRLTIIPASASDSSVRKVVKLIRDQIPLESQEATAQLIEMKDSKGDTRRLGVIDLPSFYADFNLDNSKKKEDLKSTTRDVSTLLKRLKKENIEGLVLDLRRNGGGSLEEAINLTGLFISKGPVVLVKGLDGDITVDRDTNPEIDYDGPLIVLTSRHSASASEILAGALQDYDRALIVGDKSTHGKGTVQTLLELDRYFQRSHRKEIADKTFAPGALKITIRKFYRPSGHSTQKKGVEPDIVLPSISNYAEGVGEAGLKNPLEWDFIPEDDLKREGVKFTRLDRATPYVKTLTEKHRKRIGSDQDYHYVREDIKRYRELIADKTVSLNEKARVKEREEAEARIKNRKEEIKARPESELLAYKFSLKNVTMDGLPEPNLVEEEEEDEAAEAVIKKSEKDGAKEEDEEEEKVRAIDAGMKEARLILLDYIDLYLKRGAVAATK